MYFERCQHQKKHSVILAAVILCVLSMILYSSCADKSDDDNTAPPIDSDGDTQTGTDEYWDQAPAWLTQSSDTSSAADLAAAAEKKEKLKNGTLYDNSQSSAYGNVSGLTVVGARNSGVTYDVYSYSSKEDKTVYIFLPCRADISRVVYTATHADGTVSGPYTADFSSAEPGTDDNKRVIVSGTEYKVEVLQSNIPSLQLKINEEHGKFSSVNASRDHSVFAYGDFLLEVTDELAAEKGWETVYKSEENNVESPETMNIRGRGNWTWDQLKKPYQLKTENKIDVLGMGKAKTWLLLANFMDASLLRNQLFFNLSADIGLAYSPRLEPVDLFVNGKYMGNYFISTKVEVDESRVNIDENVDFLLEFDHYAYKEVYTFKTKRGQSVTLHNQENFESLAEIEKIINEIEAMIYNVSSNEYADYIDIESWAKYYWVQDLSRNNDTLIGSSYFYYVASEHKLYAGPIWDMDNTLGTWGSGRNLKKDGWHAKEFNWFVKMIQHSDFAEAVDRLYKEGGVRELFSTLPGKVSQYEQYIQLSAEMNYIIYDRVHFVRYNASNYAEEVEYLQDFLGTRITWYENTYDGKTK